GGGLTPPPGPHRPGHGDVRGRLLRGVHPAGPVGHRRGCGPAQPPGVADPDLRGIGAGHGRLPGRLPGGPGSLALPGEEVPSQPVPLRTPGGARGRGRLRVRLDPLPRSRAQLGAGHGGRQRAHRAGSGPAGPVLPGPGPALHGHGAGLRASGRCLRVGTKAFHGIDTHGRAFAGILRCSSHARSTELGHGSAAERTALRRPPAPAHPRMTGEPWTLGGPAAPVVSNAAPVAPAAPVVGPAEPVVGPAEPVVDTADPVVAVAEPVVDTADPVVAVADPMVAVAESVAVEPVAAEPVAAEPVVAEPVVVSVAGAVVTADRAPPMRTRHRWGWRFLWDAVVVY